MGSHTNLALFVMSNPHLKHNIQHIYIMGGSVRCPNPTGFCGNLFTDFTSNPYAEFNIFADPFAAYQVCIIVMCFCIYNVFMSCFVSNLGISFRYSDNSGSSRCNQYNTHQQEVFWDIWKESKNIRSSIHFQVSGNHQRHLVTRSILFGNTNIPKFHSCFLAY